MRVRNIFLGAVLLLGGCGGGATNDSTEPTSPGCADSSVKGPVVVMAASSMVNVLTDVRDEFLESHPCVTGITFSYGSSATLAAQIVNGSPADVFISASQATMATVQNAGKVDTPSLFAKNVAEIMVNTESKFRDLITDVASLRDSTNRGVKVGLCVATAPCGSLSDTVLAKAALSRAAVADTESPSVEDLVTKIEMGELDAGIVYRSDCQFAEQRSHAVCVSIPPALNATNGYFVGALTSDAGARQFVDYINGSNFRSTLQAKYGFLAP